MSRDYCQHMVRMDEPCEHCDVEVETGMDYWTCARAWAGLAMWCMCSRAFAFDVAFDGGYLGGRSDALEDARAWQALREPVHTAQVGLGRVPGVVEVFDDGIVRLRSQSATNFYSEGLLGPAEIAAFRRQRRATIHELLKHKFEATHR